MCYSTSIKHAQCCPEKPLLISDEEEIRHLMSSLLDRIEKEFNSSDKHFMLFDATSSKVQRHLSKTSSNHTCETDDEAFASSARTDSFSDDSFHPFDEYKHSLGILLDENEKNVNRTLNRIPSRKSLMFSFQLYK